MKSGHRILGRGWSVALSTLALASAPTFAGDGVYQEDGGLLVVEFESLDADGDWKLESSVGGYAGSGYLRWAGSDHFSTPGHGTFGAQFQIHEGGVYNFRIRNHHDHPDSTLENDVWVRLDGGAWIKTFSAQKGLWTWTTNHELNNDDKPKAEYDLDPGQHTIEFSGRSKNFRIDRFHLYRPGTPGGEDPNQPESECLQDNRPPVAKISISPPAIPANDNEQTVVTLDATGSYDPDSGQQISVRWDLRGAKFVQGTGPKSPVAKVRLARGGVAMPVRLTVRDDDADDPLSTRTHSVVNVLESDGVVGGAPVAWHPLEVSFHGPMTHEGATQPNPFLGYRLDVTFDGPSGQSLTVPGFYAGDGEGSGTGDVWKACFAAHEGGLWKWTASFRVGEGVAISPNPTPGEPSHFDGASGEVLVLDRDPDAPGFLSEGCLEYVGEHYLKFADGGYFLKGGTDSPENFFGYDGFDDVQDNGGIGIVHRYDPHVKDWLPGDPLFTSSSSGVSSKGIVGALNYLSQQRVNSIYFLPMNLGGDGQETTPFLGYAQSGFSRTHYDISRLHQWAQVFDHAQRRGIQLHIVLAETESGNENWLDGGELGPQRKLFFRELVARFGHSLALKWNLSEENDYSISQLEEFAGWIDMLDTYDHPIGVHTHPNNFQDYPALLGNPLFTATSIQYSPDYAEGYVEEWRNKSAAAGHKWVIDLDENGPAGEGLTDENADDLRRRVLYDVYFSGGQVEWYAGYHSLPLGGDVRLEDFRTREDMWRYMRIAREFMEENLPFHEMKPADHLLSKEHQSFGGGEVFAKAGDVYAIYLPTAGTGARIDLSDAGGALSMRWFDPRKGEFAGQAIAVEGGGSFEFDGPPYQAGQDWVVLIQRR